MSDNLNTMYQVHTEALQRHDYFLMALAAACIAYSVQVTRDAVYSKVLGFWIIAVLCWSASIWAGCRKRLWAIGGIRTNAELIKVQAGTSEYSGNAQRAAIAFETLKEILDKDGEEFSRLGRVQFYFLVGGSVSFIAWHIITIWRRTPGI